MKIPIKCNSRKDFLIYLQQLFQNKLYKFRILLRFYYPNKVDQIECFNSKIYLKYETTITVIDEANGEIMKVLEIPCASDFAIDMSGFFVIFCHRQKKIFYLNLNCDILDENLLVDFPTNLKFYYNKYSRTMFFYDTSRYILYKMKNDKKVFKNSIHWYLQVNPG